MLNQGEYEWDDAKGIIRNDVTTMIYLILKIVNPDTRIRVSNLEYSGSIFIVPSTLIGKMSR